MQIVPLKINMITEFVPVDGTYRYNASGKFPVLQKLCFWVLSKLKCNSGYMDISTQAVKFLDSEDLVSVILSSEGAMAQIYYRRAKVVLVGRDHAERLDKDVQHMGCWVFQFPQHYQTGQWSEHGAFAGIKVVIVPWMNGIVVLPELP